jgi:hypothetical protein
MWIPEPDKFTAVYKEIQMCTPEDCGGFILPTPVTHPAQQPSPGRGVNLMCDRKNKVSGQASEASDGIVATQLSLQQLLTMELLRSFSSLWNSC